MNANLAAYYRACMGPESDPSGVRLRPIKVAHSRACPTTPGQRRHKPQPDVRAASICSKLSIEGTAHRNVSRVFVAHQRHFRGAQDTSVTLDACGLSDLSESPRRRASFVRALPSGIARIIATAAPLPPRAHGLPQCVGTGEPRASCDSDCKASELLPRQVLHDADPLDGLRPKGIPMRMRTRPSAEHRRRARALS